MTGTQQVVRSNVHSGDDGDFFQRVLRVWDKNGDMRLTFSEMLDGLAVLLGGENRCVPPHTPDGGREARSEKLMCGGGGCCSGDARQKLEIFFLMYQVRPVSSPPAAFAPREGGLLNLPGAPRSTRTRRASGRGCGSTGRRARAARWR